MGTRSVIPEKIGVYESDHDIVGFKKIFCYHEDETDGEHIAQLLVPKGSTVVVPCEQIHSGRYDSGRKFI